MDMISNLPNDLICSIVSFLAAKSAASTTILFKKWLNLFTVETDLVFDQSNNNGESFQNFVNGLLALHASCRIRRLSLKLQSVDKSQFKLVNDCLTNVLKRGIMDLELEINVKEDGYLLSLEVFTCKTVEKVKLGSRFVIDDIPKNALLPALKTLILDSVRFDDLGSGCCAFTRLLSTCPMIYELVIDRLKWEHWKWSSTISSPILKRLTIRREKWNDYDGYGFKTVSFHTPSLEYLEYFDILIDEYPVVNLNSLLEASLKLPFVYNDEEYNLRNLILGLKNVQILRVDVVDTIQMFYVFSEAVPVFQNLIHLSFISERDTCRHPLRTLLWKSPKLETATIQGGLHYEDVGCVCKRGLGYLFLTYPIKVLKITSFEGDIGEMTQIEHFLRNSLRLELLEIHIFRQKMMIKR